MGNSPPDDQRMVRRGFLLNIMNPKAVLAWTAVITLGRPEEVGIYGMAAIVSLCTLSGLLIYWAYALSFSAPPVSALYAKARRWFEGVFAIGFGLAGVKLMLSRN